MIPTAAGMQGHILSHLVLRMLAGDCNAVKALGGAAEHLVADSHSLCHFQEIYK